MSTEWTDQFDELFTEGSFSEATPEAVAVLEQAARLADLHQDDERGVVARGELVRQAIFSGLGDRALVAFTWMLAKTDQNEALLHLSETSMGSGLMWMYKWVAQGIGQFPQIPRQRIEAVLADMERRYSELGLSMRTVEDAWAQTARRLGDPEAARIHFERRNALPKDGAGDCPACETNTDVQHWLFLGDLDAAIKAGRPVLEGGQRCAEVPAITHSIMLVPLFADRQIELANKYQQRSQQQVTVEHALQGEAGHHLAYLTLIRKTNRAVNMFEKLADHAVATPEMDARLVVLTGSAMLFEQLRRDGRERIKLRVGEVVGVPRDARDAFEVAALAAWFLAQAKDVAQQFDQRNGNDYFANWVAQRMALLDRAG